MSGVPGLMASPSNNTPRMAGIPIFSENLLMASVPVKITPSANITIGSGTSMPAFSTASEPVWDAAIKDGSVIGTITANGLRSLRLGVTRRIANGLRGDQNRGRRQVQIAFAGGGPSQAALTAPALLPLA